MARGRCAALSRHTLRECAKTKTTRTEDVGPYFRQRQRTISPAAVSRRLKRRPVDHQEPVPYSGMREHHRTITDARQGRCRDVKIFGVTRVCPGGLPHSSYSTRRISPSMGLRFLDLMRRGGCTSFRILGVWSAYVGDPHRARLLYPAAEGHSVPRDVLAVRGLYSRLRYHAPHGGHHLLVARLPPGGRHQAVHGWHCFLGYGDLLKRPSFPEHSRCALRPSWNARSPSGARRKSLSRKAKRDSGGPLKNRGRRHRPSELAMAASSCVNEKFAARSSATPRNRTPRANVRGDHVP